MALTTTAKPAGTRAVMKKLRPVVGLGYKRIEAREAATVMALTPLSLLRCTRYSAATEAAASDQDRSTVTKSCYPFLLHWRCRSG
ncbi:MAG TPA: hypothetical protein VL727_16585 [Puia sp.]|nr:hypothetical protein [Puia sp.]